MKKEKLSNNQMDTSIADILNIGIYKYVFKTAKENYTCHCGKEVQKNDWHLYVSDKDNHDYICMKCARKLTKYLYEKMKACYQVMEKQELHIFGNYVDVISPRPFHL